MKERPFRSSDAVISISAWLRGEISSRAEISPRLLKQILLRSNCRWHGERFGPGRNSARAKNPSPVSSNWARIFSPPPPLPPKKNPRNRYHFFHPGPKQERQHAHRLCFRTSVNLLMEICILRPGWKWACNCNNISARWVERNFSPGWNSPCNQALSFLWLVMTLPRESPYWEIRSKNKSDKRNKR